MVKLTCNAIPDDTEKIIPSESEAETQQADPALEDMQTPPRDDDVCRCIRTTHVMHTPSHAQHTTTQVLPDSLTDALAQAAASTALALDRGASRCVVEILLAEFWDPVSGAVFNEEGDQMRWWKLSKRFVEELQEMSGGKPVKVVWCFDGCCVRVQIVSMCFCGCQCWRPIQ